MTKKHIVYGLFHYYSFLLEKNALIGSVPVTSASNEGLTSGSCGLILGDLAAMLFSLLLMNNGR